MDHFDFTLLKGLYHDLMDVLPSIIGFVLFIIAGYFFVKIVLHIVRRLLRVAKMNRIKAKLNEKLSIAGNAFQIDPAKIILGFVKWILILILIIIGSDIFNLTMVSGFAGDLLTYLPRLLAAIAIFVVGIYLASLVKGALQRLLQSLNLSGSKAIGLIVFYVIVVFVAITALNQAGINTALITNNISLILGIFLGAFALALGLGSRDIVHRLVLGYYSKMNFKVGDRVKIGDQSGTIVAIDHISLVLKTAEERIVYPIKQISDQQITILD